jgi:hypothetical protein
MGVFFNMTTQTDQGRAFAFFKVVMRCFSFGYNAYAAIEVPATACSLWISD